MRICVETFVDNAELYFGVSPLAALQDLSCGMDEIFSSVKKSIYDRAERKAAYGIISQNENP